VNQFLGLDQFPLAMVIYQLLTTLLPANLEILKSLPDGESLNEVEMELMGKVPVHTRF